VRHGRSFYVKGSLSSNYNYNANIAILELQQFAVVNTQVASSTKTGGTQLLEHCQRRQAVYDASKLKSVNNRSVS
jgi:hypothetical protein